MSSKNVVILIGKTKNGGDGNSDVFNLVNSAFARMPGIDKNSYDITAYHSVAEGLTDIEDHAEDIVGGSVTFGPKEVSAIVINDFTTMYDNPGNISQTAQRFFDDAEAQQAIHGMREVDAEWVVQKINSIEWGKHRPNVYIAYVSPEKYDNDLPEGVSAVFSFKQPRQGTVAKKIASLGTVVASDLVKKNLPHLPDDYGDANKARTL